MILFCDTNDKAALENADKELSLFRKKITTHKKKIKRRKIFKDFIKSFPFSFQLVLQKNKDSNIYIAVILAGGIGDILRQKDAVLNLISLFPNAVVDIYSKTYKSFFTDIKNIRFWLHRNIIGFTSNKYDIVLDYFTSDNITSGIADLKIINLKNITIKNFADNFEKIKQEYRYCFDVKNQYLFQKQAIDNNLKFNDVAKLTAGINDFKKINLALNFKEQDIAKFGLNKKEKYITFQHGWGNKGYVPGKSVRSTRIWITENWINLLKIIKKDLKSYKIVQVGLNSDIINTADINLIGKTSYDDLCSVIKYSSLHIDTDGGCMHIATALNVKSVILFGPSDARYVGYDNNVNIVAGQCRNCYTLKDADDKCYRRFEQPICMESISPDFVANVISKYVEENQ
jgi:ADP-heptose:LPS heptosyltransferase